MKSTLTNKITKNKEYNESAKYYLSLYYFYKWHILQVTYKTNLGKLVCKA